MKFTAFHRSAMATFEDSVAQENQVMDLSKYNRVAYIESENVDDAFRSMNSIHAAWWENENVECIEMDRSMSTGDLLYCHETEKWLFCATFGWTEVKTKGQEAKRRMDRIPAGQLA